MTRVYRRRARKHRPLRCQICGHSALELERPIVHFNLIRPVYEADGRQRNRGAGSIDLCEACWRRVVTASRLRRGWVKATC